MSNYLLLPQQRRLASRPPADQKLISNWAEDYFRKQDLEYLASVLGKRISDLKFDYEEFENFFPAHIDTTIQHRDILSDAREPLWGATDSIGAFYKAALTLDRLLYHMRTIDSIIGSANSGNVVNSLDTLAANLPQPDWVPAELKNDPHLPANINLQEFSVLGRHVHADLRLLYLIQFPIVHGLLAVTQGHYLRDPLNRDSDFDDGEIECRYYGIGQYVRSDGGAAPFYRGYTGMPGDVRDSEDIDTAATHNGGVDFDEPAPPTQLSQSLRRSGGLIALYTLFNKLMKNYEGLLVTATGNMGVGIRSFIGNLNKGPNYGNAMRCPAGTDAVYYDHNGNAIDDMRSVMYTAGGKTRLNLGKVDITKTQCVPSAPAMSARRRRRPMSAMRVPFRSVAFPRAMAARSRGRRNAPRDSKGRFIKTGGTRTRHAYHAMAVPRAMRAVPVPASFGARRKRRRTMHARKNARADWENLFDYAGISGEINPLGPDGDVDTAALKAIYNNDLPSAPAPAADSATDAKAKTSTTAAQAARRRRRGLMRATMLTPAMRAAARLAALKVNIAQARRRHRKRRTTGTATRSFGCRSNACRSTRPTMRRRALYSL